MPLQNGVEAADVVGAAAGRGRVVGGTCGVAAMMECARVLPINFPTSMTIAPIVLSPRSVRPARLVGGQETLVACDRVS